MRNVLTHLKPGALLLLVAICAAVHPLPAAAQSISVEWDAPSDATVAGYRVHVGTASGTYTQTFDVPVATTTFTFSTGVPGTTYYFAVKSFNSSNVLSGFSNEVSAHINAPPVLAPIGNRTAPAGTALSFDVAALASDLEGDPLTYAATGLPAGLSINQNSGLITGTPTATGTSTVSVTVRDQPGATASRTFTWQITPQPLTVTDIEGDHPSPQAPGRLVEFTTQATGGTPPYQFKYLVQDMADEDNPWIVARDWDADTSFTWTAQPRGTYAIQVWARNNGNTNDVADAQHAVTFETDPAYDVTAPQLQISSHVNNEVVNAQAITLSGSATDLGTGGTGVAVLVNGAGATNGTAAGEAAASWTHPMTLTPGVNVIDVVARDGSGNERRIPLTLTAQVPVTAASIAASVPSPQAAGTTITLTAASTGGVAPVQYRWWIRLGSGPWVTTAWSTGTTYAWTPAEAGSYSIVVHARSAGSTSDTPETTGFLGYTVLATMTPVTSASLSASLPSPQAPGTSIVLTASSTGGVAPVQYKWFVRQDGGAWTVMRDWSPGVNLTWTPGQAGSYSLILHARSADATGDAAQASGGLTFAVNAPVTSATLTADRSSPQTTGTPILLTASSTGGTAPVQYLWWVKQDAGAWTMLRDWSTSTSLQWVPATAGVYNLVIHVRSAGSTSSTPQASAGVTFTITAPPAPVGTATLTGSVPSPHITGASITFTAGSTGGVAPVQYRWFLRQDAGAWVLLRDWSTGTTLVWTPAVSATYNVIIHARSAGVTSDAPQASAGLTYLITAPPDPVTSVQVTSSVPSPQTTGTAITLTASATGGAAPAQYRWYVRQPTGEWVLLRDWSTTATVTWTPSAAGVFNVVVHARSAGSTASVEASAGYTFDIRP